ncbi:carboxymuconolactone decarboxylase [Sphaerisporangium siamense]|uniref:Putative peroxidase-related enzyme n=1 Tax=Sphaerisporangium siamense TaxID=795645 RepID=A0A7W7DA96_9ACTN|nr:carboxymuconolactone decarboxylase family protein [Sphaerisporangium siamense]MBB4701688.1 putative peroxidase-related enzyme [Sphaerisporangium siamense]GII84408.1 carboxymuconolactone decarboxylase [Sphaerisporangium siamense]
MAYIELGNESPGVGGLMEYRPETGRSLSRLAETLLRDEETISHPDNTLTRGERELIATYVSSLNACKFCSTSHAAFAAAQLPGGAQTVADTCGDLGSAPVSDKLKALLRIAGAVQQSGKAVTAEDVAAARATGATDLEIHDTVLIAAAFCMYNRYVDGLGTWAPDDPAGYEQAARRIVAEGYMSRYAETAGA